MKLTHLFGVIALSFAACQNYTPTLNQALKMAGDNKSELENVISHYSAIEDTLKLRAAKFLIVNMPGHYSYSGKDILSYYKEIEPILRDTSLIRAVLIDSLEGVTRKYADLKNHIVEDVKIITADYLIQNIDRAFELWRTPWASHLSFEEFCETLLPYKFVELQQFDAWKDSMTARFPLKIDTLQETESTRTALHHFSALTEEIIRVVPQNATTQYVKYYKPLSASNITLLRFGTCEDFSNIKAMALLSNGIPVVKEYFPQWGKTDIQGHCYLSLINKSGISYPVWRYRGIEPDGMLYPFQNIPKVYRQKYSYNLDRLKYYRQAKYVDKKINLFVEDVTDQYYAVSNISIPIVTKNLSDKYVYLAIFSCGQWTVLDVAKRDGNNALFEKVGRSNLYLILGYDGLALIPISDPFILENNGQIRYFADTPSNKRSVRLARKYVTSERLFMLANRARGAIHASNRSDFRTFDTICKIEPHGAFVHTATDRKYRFWRFAPEADTLCNIAELQFYNSSQAECLRGKIITNIEENDSFGDWKTEYAFDGDWLTGSCGVKPHNNLWLGLDFGKPITVERVLCVPRSDDNNIHFGDEYELRCWTNNEWSTIGRQIAHDSPLIFDSVPDPAVLWLKNLTKGKQERIFTYENGKQVWW